jgi:hypothetical protein
VAPVPLADVIAVAIEEVEDRARIEVTDAPSVAVVAHAAGDIIHLLAELMENATTFSPPTSTVRVAARRTVEHVHVTVYDGGIGMPPDQLDEVNRRLVQPSALTSTLVGTMGLLVVSRLARRHGLTVRLHSAPGGGTAATVSLPDGILPPASAADHLRTGRWRRAGEAAASGRAASAPYAEVPATAGRPGLARPADLSPAHPSAPSPVSPLVGPPVNGGSATRAPAPVNRATAAEAGHGGYTPAGLPRRVAGAAAGQRSANARPAAAPATAPGPPDPDVARARLSSLATGIAAAQRRAPGIAKRPST